MPQIELIPLAKIDPPPNPLRSDSSQAELAELMQSIRLHGILQPLILNKHAERYVVIAGARRYLAALSLGLPGIPAVVLQVSDDEALVLALHENLFRKDLNPLEQAFAMSDLELKYHLTREKIAQLLGFSKAFVTQRLDILTWPQVLQTELSAGRLSFSVAREISKIPDSEHLSTLILQAETSGATSRVVATWVQDYFSTHPQPEPELPKGSRQPEKIPNDDNLKYTCFTCQMPKEGKPNVVPLCPECYDTFQTKDQEQT